MGNSPTVQVLHEFDQHKTQYSLTDSPDHVVTIPLAALPTKPSDVVYTTSDPPQTIATYKPEGRRFAVMFAIAFTGATGMLQWLSIAPGSDTLAEYYSAGDTIFQIANISFFVGAFFGVILAFYLLSCNDFGIRKLTLIAAAFILAGTALRVVCSFPKNSVGFAILCVANAVTALSSGVLIIMPTNVAITWFGTSEQTTATGMTLGGSGLGSVIGYILGAVMITDPSDLWMWFGLNVILLGFGFISFLLVFYLVDDEPDSFPSPAAKANKTEKAKFTSFKAFRDQSAEHVHMIFWIMLVQDVLGVSVYWTLQTTLQTALNDKGYSRYEQNVTGIVFQLSGLVGTLLFSFIVDYFNILRVGSIVAWIASTIVLGLFSLRLETTWLGTDVWSVYVLSTIMGLIFSSVPPIALQLACETVFPIPPALVSACLFMLAQLSTIAVLALTRVFTGETAFIIMFSIMCVAMLLSISNWWTPLKRTEMNQEYAIHGHDATAAPHDIDTPNPHPPSLTDDTAKESILVSIKSTGDRRHKSDKTKRPRNKIKKSTLHAKVGLSFAVAYG